MTTPNTDTRARLRELIAKVGEWPDLGTEDRSDGSFRCPLCDGQGDIDAEFVRDGRREYGNDSWFSIVGVQVYGVGDAMAAMEELLPLLIKHVPSLLAQLAAQAAEIERLRSIQDDIGGIGGCADGSGMRAVAAVADANERADKARARVVALERELAQSRRYEAVCHCGAPLWDHETENHGAVEMEHPCPNADRVAELEAEVGRLRAAMLSALSATRAKVDADCSTECLCLGADEIRLCIRRMDQERVEQTARAERSIACGAEALNKLDAARLRASEQRIRADKAEARVVELEDILARICDAWCDEDCEFDVAGPRAIRDGRAALSKREGGR